MLEQAARPHPAGTAARSGPTSPQGGEVNQVSPHPAGTAARSGPTSPQGGEVKPFPAAQSPDSPDKGASPTAKTPDSPDYPSLDRGRVRVLSVLVEDGPNTLTKVSGVIRRRGFHVRGISVGPSRQPGRSRITLEIDHGHAEADQVRKQLERLVAVIGYGSQGRAHALNLRDSAEDVRVGLYPGSKSIERVEADGLRAVPVPEAVSEATVVMILTPDAGQGKLFHESVEAHLRPRSMLMFAHGFAIHFAQIKPNQGIDVAMIAPKGPGHLVRSTYVSGQGVPALIAVQQDATGHAWRRALAYARSLGAGRAGILETTFKEETETDLFGEQAVLCGGVANLVKTGFETLVEAGYQPELAYFEVLP